MICRSIVALYGTSALIAVVLPSAALAQAAPQGPGAPPVAAGVQVTGEQPQFEGPVATTPQPQAPGGGIVQDTTPQQDGGLQDIIVTATRTATDLQKTPTAVTAVTTDMLNSRGVTRLDDVGQFVPSYSSATNGTRVSIRGMGVDGVAFSSIAAVGTYVDDVFYIGGNNVGLYDVDRVEVLRGPQGTLFGRNTIGGAIQYVSRKPTDQFEGYVDGIGGSYNRHDFQGAINIPLGDMLAIRLSGNSQDRDGYVYDIYNNRYNGDILQRQGRVQLRFKPDPRLTIDLEGNAYHQSQNARADVPGGINPDAQLAGLAYLFGETRPLTNALLPPRPFVTVGDGSPDDSHSDYYSVQGTILFNVSSHLDLKSITGYQHLDTFGAVDADLTPLNIISFQGAPANITTLITQEGQLIGQFFDDRLRFTLGAYYFDSANYTVNSPGYYIGNFLLPSQGDTETDITSRAVYGQASYNLTDRLSVTGGLRYSSETNVTFNRAPGSTRLTSTFHNVSPYVGANYQLNPDTFLYAKWSKGFRAGGQTVNTNFPNGHIPFDPETASTWEAGARIELLDHTVRFNPTFYLTRWDNIQFAQTIITAQGPQPATLNAGDATIKGIELEGEAALTKRLVLNVAASFADSHYTRVPALTRTIYPQGNFTFFPPPPTIVLPSIDLNSPLNRSPGSKVAFGARYTLPVGDDNKFIFSFSGTYTSSQYANVTVPDRVFLPSTTIFQTRGQYDFGHGKYSAAVFVTNLFNKYYFTDGIGTNSYAIGVDERDVARPREFGGQVTVRF